MLKKINSREVYSNKWMTVFEDEIKFSGGGPGIYAYVQRSNGAGLAVVDSKNRILLVKQYRYPIKDYDWNLPGGAIDTDKPQQGAIRETEEETGIEVKKVEKIGEFYPLSSCSTEKYYVYLARVEPQKMNQADVSEQDEYVGEKRFILLKNALKMIDKGEITDSTTANIIQIVARKLKVV